jgi:hypothetical protein
MRQIVSRATRVVYALTIAAALTFGGAQVFGSSTSDPCSPIDSTMRGSCDVLGGPAGCQASCEQVGGFIGECDTSFNCCHCAHR